MAEPDGTNRGRPLAVAAILAVAGAGLSALAAAMTWWSADYLDPLSGALTIAASGATCVPELIGLALVALAGFGAALATRGVLRRLVAMVIGLCGATLAVRSGLSLGHAPAALITGLIRPADPVGSAQLHPLGPLLAVLGGLLLVAAGVLVGIGGGARRAIGTRYERPSKAPAAVLGEAATDQGDWWKALDAGDDPTAHSTIEGAPGYPPAVSEHTSGDGYDDPNASRPT